MRREGLVHKQLDSPINGLATGLLADSVESLNKKKKNKSLVSLDVRHADLMYPGIYMKRVVSDY